MAVRSERGGRLASRPGPRGASRRKPADWVARAYAGVRRTRARRLEQLVPGGGPHPLRWALAETGVDGGVNQLVGALERLQRARNAANARAVRRKLAEWLDAACGRPLDRDLALECLVWAHALPEAARVVGLDQWRRLVEALETAARRAGSLGVARAPLVRQLLAGELPLTLAWRLPQAGPQRRWIAAARRTLSEGVHELLDGEGLPGRRHLDLLRPLLACWTRCGYLARSLGAACFDRGAALQYAWLVRQSLRLTRSDGSQVFSNGEGNGRPDGLLAAALRLDDDPADQAVAAQLLPGRLPPRPNRRSSVEPPAPSVYSEWSQVAVLRGGWAPACPQLAVTYGDGQVGAELAVRGRVLWSGPCPGRLTVDDRPVPARGDWEEVCWFSDPETDYLELELPLEDGWKVQRQMLLARPEALLLWADAVIGRAAGRLVWESRLPLAGGVRFEGEAETWDGVLRGASPLAVVMPLALPEWRIAPREGELAAENGQLVLRQGRVGRALYAPLAFALDGRQLRAARTWRRLTVAENRRIVSADLAVGYRIQVGGKQWLVYRALAEPANRSVLGQNVSSEFFAARFLRSGAAESLVEVE